MYNLAIMFTKLTGKNEEIMKYDRENIWYDMGLVQDNTNPIK